MNRKRITNIIVIVFILLAGGVFLFSNLQKQKPITAPVSTAKPPNGGIAVKNQGYLKDLYAKSPEYSKYPITKIDQNSFTFKKPNGTLETQISQNINCKDENGNWQPIDTTLILKEGEYKGYCTSASIKTDGTVKVLGTNYTQKTQRFGYFNPSTQKFESVANLPQGKAKGNQFIRTTDKFSHQITVSDNGVKEELMLKEKPAGEKTNDYLAMETVVTGITFPDGLIEEFKIGSKISSPPITTDAKGNKLITKSFAKNIAGTQYIYTGVLQNQLAQAQFPVTIDPDYATTTDDGFVTGQNADYTTARSTSASYDVTGATAYVGNSWNGSNYLIRRIFLKFDTSAIPDGNTVTQVNLTLTPNSVNTPGGNFDVQIIKQDWSSQDPISAGTREAAYDNSLSGTADTNIWKNSSAITAWTRYTGGNLDTTYVNKTGYTYYSLRSSRDYAGNTPTDFEQVGIVTQDDATNTTDRPVLTVTSAVAPTITSPTQTSITATGATLGGNVTADGGASITARGVCYSVTATNSNPQIGGTGVTCTPEGGTTTGVFTEAITGLSGGTAYTFNAYATNSVGTSYSAAGATTDYADSTADGYVRGSNASYATSRSTSTSFGSDSDPLWVGQYYDATPLYNTYRSGLKFDTSGIPDTATATQVNLKMADTSDDSTTDFDVQIVKLNWSAQDPLSDANREAFYDNCLAGTADNSIWRNTNGMVDFTQYASGNLDTTWVSKTGYTYYCLRSSLDYSNTQPTTVAQIRPASQENATAGYRPVLTITYTNNTFTTLTAAPTIDTPTKTPLHGSDATLGGNVTSDGGATVTGRGVCVGASADPALGGNCFSTSGTTGVFTVSATGLTQGTLYHYRAYATNSVGTSYTTDDTFTTLALNNYLVTVASPQAVGVCVTGTNTLTARDSTNTTITTDSSTVNMTSSGTGVTFYTTSGCSSSTTQYTMSSGTANIYYKTNKAQSFTITATKASSTETGTSSSITVNAGSQTRLVVTLPGQTFTDGSGNSGSVTNQTVNGQFTITSLTATDDYFNVITGYSGAKTLVYAGPTVTGGTTYTTAVNFTSGVSTTTLYTILTTAQTTTITVTDGGLYGYASSNLTVNAAPPPKLLIKGGVMFKGR